MKGMHVLFAVATTLAGLAASAAVFSDDFVACTHGTTRMLESGPDLVAFGSESWGIVASSTTKE